MVLLPCAPQQRLVGRILDERVLERVGSLGRDAPLRHDLRLHELRQRRLKGRGVQGRDGLHHVIGKCTPDRGPQLRHDFGGREAIQPRQESIMQGGGDRQGGSGPGSAYQSSCSSSSPDSSTVLVSSSTNSGTPSVLRTTSWSTAEGNALSPAICIATRATWSGANRRRVSAVRWATIDHGGGNSGRAVSTRQSRAR